MWKAWLPATVYAIASATGSSNDGHSDSGEPSVTTHKSTLSRPVTTLAVISISAFSLLWSTVKISSTVALGICNTSLLALAFILTEKAYKSGGQTKRKGAEGLLSEKPLRSGQQSNAEWKTDERLLILRDLSFAIAGTCALGSFVFGDFKKDAFLFRAAYTDVMTKTWNMNPYKSAIAQGSLTILVAALKNLIMVDLIRQRGALQLGLFTLIATVFAQLTTSPSSTGFWWCGICVVAYYLYSYDVPATSPSARGPTRLRKAQSVLVLVAFLSFVVLAVKVFLEKDFVYRDPIATPVSQEHVEVAAFPPQEPFQPLEVGSRREHPMDLLMKQAEQKFEQLKGRQSRTLGEAVAEYRRRYQILPPPNFDKWYEFATRRGVQLIDEYDAIYDSLLPFWSLEPEVVRARVREAIGFSDNWLIALLIRDKQVTKVDDGPEWQQQATVGMINQFIEFLPDMDLAFNIHDEPRVVVPSEDLSRMVAMAKNSTTTAAVHNVAPRNAFSPRPEDMNDGKRIVEVKTTRFNVFAHQPTWTHARLPCSPESAARTIGDSFQDNGTAFAIGELGFIYNYTAFSDICNSPSFRETHGFFDRPNAFNIVSDLFPIFSQSKVSSFQDILYPSPWYWAGKVAYDEGKDMDWTKKENVLYWRGSTTGGFSRSGGWRRQHRQQVVRKINALDNAMIMANTGEPSAPNWQPKKVRRPEYKDIIDVRFSHVGQCDPGDCDAQKEFFKVAPSADQQDAWRYKYLLDMDGNAFSGRFYAFLKSKSLVFKMAVFQEWHMDWLKPWVHYIPFSLRGDEWLEAVRYFAGEEEGKLQGPRMAMQGREWANKALRNEDFEAWFFRLLLEYGRVIDDNRETIGYSGL